MFFWYKLLTYLFYPFSFIYLFLRILKKKEHPKRYKKKLSQIHLPRGNGFLTWFHVASVGEAMSIVSLIQNCIDNEKIDKILITSITLSSGKVIEKRFGKNKKVIHQFLPLDIPILTNKFLKHWQPNLSIFIDSEIWPNLILNIKKKNIPLLLLNARITKKSFERWKLAINFSKKIFEKFDLCIASDKESENFLKILGAKNITNYGNLKYSNSNTNLNNNLDTLFLEKIKNRKIWCATSTHPTEEIFCAKAHIKLKKNYKNILTIIIPRHVDRVKKINTDLLNLNLETVFYSSFEKINEKTDILLIDTYGEATKFYNISKCVFLGKSISESLKHDSGQNPIEPARLGCKIVHGPNVINFSEIYEYLKKLGITKKINTTDELGQTLFDELKDDKVKVNDGKIMKEIDNYGQNILNNVVKELEKYI